MDWNLPSFLLLISVSQSAAFNLDSSPWKNYPQNLDTAFGYKVIQRDRSLIVSDPLIQNLNKRGQIYRCELAARSCSPLPMNEPPEAVNMSLGLSMTKDPMTSQIIACGPTIPKNCKIATTYNGMCFTVDGNSRVERRIPTALRDCPVPPQTDIAFLLDGSGSVSDYDFKQMKNFVVTLLQGLISRDIRFAVAQYSYYCTIHIPFTSTLVLRDIQNIQQMDSMTFTGRAINKLVRELFINARPDAHRVLVVITDGESSGGDDNLYQAAENARRNNILRYAIGVGAAFTKGSADRELNIIASDPDQDFKFKVGSFDVLDKIRKNLEENIIAIEGTQTSGDSTRMEFAQDGFSAEFLSNGNVLLSAVGAYQWKGGYQEYSSTGPSGDFQVGREHDSYLGYSMTVARTPFTTYVIQGAPRHGHIGKVFISTSMGLATLNPPVKPQLQIGSYFGAEVCAVDLDVDSVTDLLLVSAPLFTQDSKEGIVFVYSVPRRLNYWSDPFMTLQGMAGQRGRFGSSLASPGDLNGDKITDIVVGAPLEDDRQGSIYIFNGRGNNISPTYSQRISGSSVQSGLRFFGLSLSQNALDQSEDGLLDIAVGSKGTAMLFRSRPIVSLVTTVTYNPRKIPPKETECEKPLQNTVTVCFRLTEQNTRGKDLTAKLNYDLKLDAKRQTFRAFFQDKPKKERVQRGEMEVGLRDACKIHSFFIESCTEDALNPLSNELTFTFEGLPSRLMQALTPILHPDIRNTSDHNLDFEINCGPDNICIDDLKVDFNFSGHSDIQVGIMQEMNVTVFVENRGENSYNPQVTLTYPFGLSYRRFTSKQGRVECVSVDSDQLLALGKTTCYISKPILRQSSFAVFEITYSIHKDSNFDKLVTFSATASSGNDQHAVSSELAKNKSIGVKYAIYIALIRHENSSIHINFTAGKNNQEKPISQILKVENDLRDVNLTVLISVPIKLGEKDIWTNKNLQISGCSSDRDEKPTVTDFVEAIRIKPLVNCSVATCRRFRCNTNILKRGVELYIISAKVSSGWIEQTGLTAAVFELVSSATLDYDKNKYVYVSSDSQHNAPIVTINTQVEVYEEKNLLKEIIGGVIGGLVLLALITAGLYKAGFFKSQYKQMLEDAGGEQTAAPDGETLAE